MRMLRHLGTMAPGPDAQCAAYTRAGRRYRLPGKAAIDDLAARLDSLGESHAGVHRASFGWILPLLHDPDGHEVRFYTMQHHTDLSATGVTTVQDPRERAARREREHQAAAEGHAS